MKEYREYRKYYMRTLEGDMRSLLVAEDLTVANNVLNNVLRFMMPQSFCIIENEKYQHNKHIQRFKKILIGVEKEVGTIIKAQPSLKNVLIRGEDRRYEGKKKNGVCGRRGR